MTIYDFKIGEFYLTEHEKVVYIDYVYKIGHTNMFCITTCTKEDSFDNSFSDTDLNDIRIGNCNSFIKLSEIELIIYLGKGKEQLKKQFKKEGLLNE